jgi:hypothetical protein
MENGKSATGPASNGSDEEFMRVYGKLNSPQYFKTEEITSSEAASQGT